MQPSEIWEVALGELQTHVSQVLFQTHLQDTTCAGIQRRRPRIDYRLPDG